MSAGDKMEIQVGEISLKSRYKNAGLKSMFRKPVCEACVDVVCWREVLCIER